MTRIHLHGGTFTVRINDEHVARVMAARRQLFRFRDACAFDRCRTPLVLASGGEL